MKHLINSTKAKLIIASIIFVVVFSLGAYARPGIDNVSVITSALFSSKPQAQYVAPLTPQEAIDKAVQDKIDQLWKSDKHQITCRNNAAYIVSAQLSSKMIDQTDLYSAMGKFDSPFPEVVPAKKK